MIRYLASVIATVTVFAAVARSQSNTPVSHRHWEFSFFGGGSFMGENTYPTPVLGSPSETSRSVGLRYATGSLLGVRLTENRGRRWGAAFDYSFSNQPLSFTNLSSSVPSLGAGQSVHRFQYDVLYYLLDKESRLRPYVLAGSGVSLFYVHDSGKSAAAAQGIHLSSPWKFAVSWGGGLKYLVWDQVAVSFQYSDTISGIPSYSLPSAGRWTGSQYTPGFLPEGFLHNSLLSLGFVYQWGER